MALPSNYTTVPVFGDYITLDGAPLTGDDAKLTFEITPILTDVTSTPKVTIIPRPIVAVLNGSGHFSINLPSTDDPDILPGPFVYKVTEGWQGGESFYMEIPLLALENDPPGIDMATVTRGVVTDPEISYYVTQADLALAMGELDTRFDALEQWHVPIYVLEIGEDLGDVPPEFPASGLIFQKTA